MSNLRSKSFLRASHISSAKLKKIWSQVPPNYYDVGIKKNLFQKLWHTHKLTQVKKILPKKSRQILDIGCSSAVLTAKIAKILPKSKITGLDSYKDAIDFAQVKYPHIKFIVADAHNLPFKKAAFDLVICTETLEHLIDPKLALSEMKRVLKKHGAAILSMDSGSLLFRLIWFFWTKTKGRVWQNAHLHEFNAILLEDLIKEVGFKIKKRISSHLGMAITFLAVPKNRI
ncbi:class I SAM-dependent methyltransferase [Candidatus Curtissbacteria bacterium]|nr:class I SAM-dependent methyltransferase [Candidatus Curtissbacteria bacterium]